MSCKILKCCFFLVIMFLEIFQVEAQKWIETKYKISTTQDLVYAEVLDFAGNRRSLASAAG